MQSNNKNILESIEIYLHKPRFILMNNYWYSLSDNIFISCLLLIKHHDVAIGNNLGHSDLVRSLINLVYKSKNAPKRGIISFIPSKNERLKFKVFENLIKDIPNLNNQLENNYLKNELEDFFTKTENDLIESSSYRKGYNDLILLMQLLYKIYGDSVIHIVINYFFEIFDIYINKFSNSILNNTHVPIFRTYFSSKSHKFFPFISQDYINSYSNGLFRIHIDYKSESDFKRKIYSSTDINYLIFSYLISYTEKVKPNLNTIDVYYNDVKYLFKFSEFLLSKRLESNHSDFKLSKQNLFSKITNEYQFNEILNNSNISKIELNNSDFDNSNFNYLAAYTNKLDMIYSEVNYQLSFDENEWKEIISSIEE